MNDNADTNTQKARKFSRDHFVAILGVITGAVIAVAVPFWDTYVVQTSELNIEIISIERPVSDDAGVLLDSVEDLRFLKKYTQESSLARILDEEDLLSGKKQFNAEQLKKLLNRTKESFKGLSKKIESQSKNVDKVSVIKPEQLSFIQFDTLNRPLPRDKQVPRDIQQFRENRKNINENMPYFQELIEKLTESYKEVLDESNNKYIELQNGIPIAERVIEKISQKLQDNNSYFSISAVLSNSGRASTSVKRPALLRIYIGSQNYVDLELKLQDYKNTAEISEYGAQIATYHSEEISKLPEDDQNLINTYWGQSVPAVLFKEDIAGNVLQSNEITFSEGLNEKLIIDRLRQFASIYTRNKK